MGLFGLSNLQSTNPVLRIVIVFGITSVLVPIECAASYGLLQSAAAHHRPKHTQYRRPQRTSCKRHYHEWQPPLPIPPIPHFWPDSDGPQSYQYENNHHQYTPVKIEPYSLPRYHNEKKSVIHFEPSVKSDQTSSSSQELYEPQSNPYREEQPVIYRIQKRKKSKKRKKKPKQHKEYQGFVGTTPKYSVNKIIVIEESDIPKDHNNQNVNQVEKPPDKDSQTEMNKNPFINIKDFYPKRPDLNQAHMTTSTSNKQMLPIDHLIGSLPAKSIQEIHQRLNQTLLQNGEHTKTDKNNESGHNRHQTAKQWLNSETLHTNANNVGANLSRESITDHHHNHNNNGSTGAFNHNQFRPFHVNETGKMTNYSNFFIKSNKFSYENSWNYLTSTSTESSGLTNGGVTSNTGTQLGDHTSLAVTSTKNGGGSGGDRIISGNTLSRQWMSMTGTTTTSTSTTATPPVYYFTSQRNFIPPPTVGTKPTNLLQTSGSDKMFAARNRGQNADPHNGSGSHESSSSSHKKPKLDISKVATIIFGFCISMMVLAGLILVVLHKETVTERLRTITDAIETQYSNRFRRSNQGNDSESGNSANNGPDAHFQQPHHHHHHNHHHNQPHQVHRQHRQTEPLPVPPQSSLPAAPPPPPPPLPPPPLQPITQQQCLNLAETDCAPQRRINQDLIEEIIGRPENSFSNKKCRQYFSRVHRWVPKRPALPDNLKHISTNIDPNVTNEP